MPSGSVRADGRCSGTVRILSVYRPLPGSFQFAGTKEVVVYLLDPSPGIAGTSGAVSRAGAHRFSVRFGAAGYMSKAYPRPKINAVSAFLLSAAGALLKSTLTCNEVKNPLMTVKRRPCLERITTFERSSNPKNPS